MLRHDIEQEQIDVSHYLKLAAMAEKDGLADLKMKMEEQAADEAQHGEKMRRMLA
jgi:rubrerythrin